MFSVFSDSYVVRKGDSCREKNVRGFDGQKKRQLSRNYFVPIRKPRETQMQFSIWKRAIFRKVKEIKDLS